jgi:GT2 family glycosyltransferase
VIRYVVPYRADGGIREGIWAFCRGWWADAGIFPVEAPSPDGPFNRAAAINAGASGPWDVLVVLDADVIAPGPQVYRAAENALGGGLWLGFTEYLGLSAAGTEATIRRGNPVRAKIRRSLTHESSIVAIGRGLWEELGGFDERFIGWGQEDVAFVQAARMLGYIGRVPGTVYHLWHPVAREKRRSDPLWQANQALGRRYREARSATAIREILCEQPSSLTSTNATHGTA